MNPAAPSSMCGMPTTTTANYRHDMILVAVFVEHVWASCPWLVAGSSRLMANTELCRRRGGSGRRRQVNC